LLAEIDGLLQALGELDAGRAIFKVLLDFAARLGRQVHIEILGQQLENLLTLTAVLMFH
jgi:hypothetical protein